MTSRTADAESAAPSWIAAQRGAAASALADVDVPTTEDEAWRYSPIGEISLDRPRIEAPIEAPPAPVPGTGVRVALRDGIITTIEISADAEAAGVSVVAGRSGAEAPFSTVESDDYISLLNRSATFDPVFVDVPRGVVVPGPIVIDHQVTVDDTLVATDLAVRLGANSEATVVDIRSGAEGSALVVPVSRFEVGDAARLRLVDAQFLGEQTWQLAHQLATVGRDATWSAHISALGARYGRIRTDVELAGRGASAAMAAAYFAGEDQTLDFRSFVDHVAPDTTSNLLFTGAGGVDSRSIYSGLIRVGPGASGTVAHQTNRTVKLAESAWAESVPNLEIENNDVQCSHASTVGPIEEDQQFYLESRGVPPSEARRLILRGFFDEVVSAIPDDGVRDRTWAAINDRLEGVS